MDCKVHILSKAAHINGRMASLHALMAWLFEQGVPGNDSYPFIASSERMQYVAQNLDCHVISGVLGCGAQVFFAAEHMYSLFGRGMLILHFDDDVVGLQRARPDNKLEALPAGAEIIGCGGQQRHEITWGPVVRFEHESKSAKPVCPRRLTHDNRWAGGRHVLCIHQPQRSRAVPCVA